MNSCRNPSALSKTKNKQEPVYLLLLTVLHFLVLIYWLGSRSVFFLGIGRPESESMPRETGRIEPPFGLPPKPPDGGVGRELPFPLPPLPPEALPPPFEV